MFRLNIPAVHKKVFLQLGLSVLAILVALIILEVILQIMAYQPVAMPLPEHVQCENCSYLYEPAPNVGSFNSLGLKGPEVDKMKKQGVFRVIVIGDSVTYGSGVEESQTFVRKLESLLSKDKKIEVINAGVRGYTSYNEVRYLRDKLMGLLPDLVIFQTCMNDIANPRWHWNEVSKVELIPPADAFPRSQEQFLNPPTSRLFDSPLRHSLLYTLGYFSYLKYKGSDIEQNVTSVVDGKSWPIYITAESEHTILPLLDYDSSEWIWLRKQFDIARDVTKAAGIPLVFLIQPLGYELEEGYPFNPEFLFMRYCSENNLLCLNLREGFTGHSTKELYLLRLFSKVPNLTDIWHFTMKGHELTADLLQKFLVQKNLVPH